MIEILQVYRCAVCGVRWDSETEARAHAAHVARHSIERETERARVLSFVGRSLPVYQLPRYPEDGYRFVLSGKVRRTVVGAVERGSPYGDTHAIFAVLDAEVPRIGRYDGDYELDFVSEVYSSDILSEVRAENPEEQDLPEGDLINLTGFGKDWTYFEKPVMEWEAKGGVR